MCALLLSPCFYHLPSLNQKFVEFKSEICEMIKKKMEEDTSINLVKCICEVHYIYEDRVWTETVETQLHSITNLKERFRVFKKIRQDLIDWEVCNSIQEREMCLIRFEYSLQYS